jgi:hypothetical protein
MGLNSKSRMNIRCIDTRGDPIRANEPAAVYRQRKNWCQDPDRQNAGLGMTSELSTDGELSFYYFDSSLGVGKSITSPSSHVGTSPQFSVAARSSDSERLTLTIALLTFPSIASRIYSSASRLPLIASW